MCSHGRFSQTQSHWSKALKIDSKTFLYHQTNLEKISKKVKETKSTSKKFLAQWYTHK